jgi:hypothetical protein
MRVTIANVGTSEFWPSRTFGLFHILPCEKGKPYGITYVFDAKDRLDMGEMQYQWVPINARDIANDLVAADHLDDHGIFVCAGERPTAEELAKANAKRLAFYKRKLAEGDSIFAKFKRHELIEDDSRRAALFLGERREWAYEVLRKVACPGCGEMVIEGIAKHSCGAIISIDQALAAGVIDETFAKQLRARRANLKKKAGDDKADDLQLQEQPAGAAAE